MSFCLDICHLRVSGYHLLLHPGVLWACLFNVTWALALWSYLQTSLTDPGSPASPEWQAWAQARQGERSLEQWQKDAEEEGDLGILSWGPFGGHQLVGDSCPLATFQVVIYYSCDPLEK